MILFLAPLSAGAGPVGMSLLYNPGPRWHAAKVLVIDSKTGQNTCGPGTTLAEADNSGAPLHACGSGYRCADNVSIPAAPGGSCASYEIDTRAGWYAADQGKAIGWDTKILSGGSGTPMIYRYRNDATGASDPCTLREIGTIYQGYGGGMLMDGQFRRNVDGSPIRMGQFSHVLVTFSAAVPPEMFKPARCDRAPTAYVTADFHIGYLGRGGVIEQHQLLGVLIYGMRNLDLAGQASNSETLWHGNVATTPSRLLHGEMLAHMPMMILPQLNGHFQSVQIDYKPLFAKYYTPPPGHTLDDAVIIGLDVYSSVRGADITFDVKNIDIVGYH